MHQGLICGVLQDWLGEVDKEAAGYGETACGAESPLPSILGSPLPALLVWLRGLFSSNEQQHGLLQFYIHH